MTFLIEHNNNTIKWSFGVSVMTKTPFIVCHVWLGQCVTNLNVLKQASCCSCTVYVLFFEVGVNVSPVRVCVRVWVCLWVLHGLVFVGHLCAWCLYCLTSRVFCFYGCFTCTGDCLGKRHLLNTHTLSLSLSWNDVIMLRVVQHNICQKFAWTLCFIST